MIHKRPGKFRLMVILILALMILLISGCSVSIVPVSTGMKPAEKPTKEGTEVTTAEIYNPPRIFVSEQDWDDGMISGLRTGLGRPGISGGGNAFDTTNRRVYFMQNINGLPLLYYGTHNSDLILPLCNQEFCKHNSERCGAYFGTDSSVCFYREFLYVNSGSVLYRMNPDGTEREIVLDVLDGLEGDYDGITEPRLWNGVFTFYVTKTVHAKSQTKEKNQQNDEIQKAGLYYYTLNGKMGQPQRMEDVTLLHNDGDTFLVQGTEETGGRQILYEWDPRDNDLSMVLDSRNLPEESPAYGETDYTNGYWGRKTAYFLSQNILYRLDYQTGDSEMLYDTQLTGVSRLSCFQDSLLLCEMGDRIRLHVYDWKFQQLGCLEMPEGTAVLPEDVICGESRDRIYLAKYSTGVPEYYLNQYDFGFGKMELHPLKYAGINLDDIFANVNT